MKILLQSGVDLINICLVMRHVYVKSFSDNHHVIRIPGFISHTRLDKSYTDLAEATQECERINKWIDEFIDHEQTDLTE